MAMALLIAHPAEPPEIIAVGFQIARRLDKPLAVLCPQPLPDGDAPETKDRFLNQAPYAEVVRQRVDDVQQRQANLATSADVIEIPSELREIRKWLLQPQATDALGRFSIDELFIPRLNDVDADDVQNAKDALFAMASCQTIYIGLAGGREPELPMSKVGYLGSTGTERKIAKHFAHRLQPDCLVKTAIDAFDHDLDGVVAGVIGPAAVDRCRQSNFWKSVTPEAEASAVMVVNRADSRLQRLMLWLDDTIRERFAEYQMSRPDREKLAGELRTGTRASPEFVLFMVLATSLACIGLLQDSAAVIIGAMLVAPLMTPLLGAGLSLIQGNLPLFRAAVRATLTGVLLSFLIGAAMGSLIAITPDRLFLDAPLQLTNEMISRSHPNLLDPLIGLAAGLAGGFAIGRDRKLGAIAGVAIAAALVPPIATAGLEAVIVGLAMFRVGFLEVISQLLLKNPEAFLKQGNLLGSTADSVENVRLVVAPLVLFLMNACTVVMGAFLGLRMVGMHRTTYPKKSRRWVVPIIFLLVTAITFFLLVTPVLMRVDWNSIR